MKIGLVFAGGGGKGGYEIGVWKYLHEIGLDKKISVISGTSVGGLNAALVSCVTCDVAEHIWTTEINDKILDKNSSSRKNGALFSRTGLISIINKYVDFEIMKSSGKEVFVTCYNTKKLEAESFKLNKYDSSDIKTLLCATSAIPVAFQNETLEGYKYVDGGIKDNIPFRPLIQEGCTHAIIVMLDDTHNDYSGFDIKTLVLHPSTDLGSIFSGTLDFSLDRSKERIKLGYNDCKNKDLELKSFSEEIMTNEDMETLTKINEMNDKAVLLETLKKLVIDPTSFGQIQCNMNAEMRTAGGKFHWNNIAEFGGLKFQQNKLTKHLRLLDSMDNRKAWGNYQKMVDVCKQFLMREAKKDMEIKTDTSVTVEERLLKLNELYGKGLITETDFNKRKEEILAEV